MKENNSATNKNKIVLFQKMLILHKDACIINTNAFTSALAKKTKPNKQQTKPPKKNPDSLISMHDKRVT